MIRSAYFSHFNWVCIKNVDEEGKVIDFKQKIERSKEAVLDVIGKNAGTKFYKKILLKKIKTADKTILPIDLSMIDQRMYEEIYIYETFINQKSNEGKVIMCSIEKKGNENQGFTYTHKLSLL